MMNVFPALVVLVAVAVLCCGAAAVMPAQSSLPGARSSSNAGIRVARVRTWGVLQKCIGQRLQSKWLAPRGLDDDGGSRRRGEATR